MKKLMFGLALLFTAPAPGIASEMKLAATDSITVEQPASLPYEIVIGSGCSYNYDHMSDVVEHVFKRRGISPLWQNDSPLTTNDLYLSISVECTMVTERNKSYTTSIQFARYDETPLAHDAEYGMDGYGSDRLFNKRLGESVDAALKKFINVNQRQG